MVNDKMKLQKAEHDAWMANAEAGKNAALIDYLAMMADIEIPSEEDAEIEEEEIEDEPEV